MHDVIATNNPKRISRIQSTGNLIGLVGRAGAGKDTAAAALAPLGYHRVAFADALKQVAYDADPVVEYGAGGDESVRLSYLVDMLGWDRAKREHEDVRAFLQNLGVAMRDAQPGIWVHIGMAKAALLRADGRHVVITDVRFEDEVQAVRDAGGLVVRIDRPGGTADGDGGHVSEQVERLDVNLAIVNDGTVGDLADVIRGIASVPF